MKRFWDIIISFFSIILFSPIFLILILLGLIFMQGNPFFVQNRPGKKGKIFKLIKFRSMSNKKDSDGNLLPDEKRLNSYGKILRKTSIDEFPELINIFIGNMSIIGPRPLLVKYLPLYNDEQRRRHDVRPGLTGYSQINGRNSISWSEKFKYDIFYVDNLSLWLDIKIFFKTFIVIFKHEGISSDSNVTMEEFTGNE